MKFEQIFSQLQWQYLLDSLILLLNTNMLLLKIVVSIVLDGAEDKLGIASTFLNKLSNIIEKF